MSEYDNLIDEAKRLNVPTNSGVYKPRSETWTELQITEYELFRRVEEEKRSRRENKLFWIALASSIASIVSALAAFVAVI